MPRYQIPCLAFLIGLITVAASATVDWQTDINAALQRARTERKLLIIEIRHPQCPPCNVKLEEMAYPVWEHPAMAQRLANFIMVRINEPLSSQLVPGSLLATIVAQSKSPSVTLADAAEQVIMLVKPGSADVTYETFASMVIDDAKTRQLLLAGAEARLAGTKGDPDNAIGLALVQMGDPNRAITFFQTASRTNRSAGQIASAQRADLNSAYCWYASGRQIGGKTEQKRTGTARGLVANVIAHPASRDVEAEALYMQGVLYLSEGRSSSPPAPAAVDSRPAPGLRSGSSAAPPPPPLGPMTTQTGDPRRAIESFRKAYALAAPGSDVLAAARSQLESLDDQPLPRRADAEKTSSFRLLLPARQPLLGNVEVSVEADLPVHRVDYYVDDLRLASSDRNPFRTKLALGAVPTLRTIKARAFDANGNAISEAVQTVNDRADAVHVAITAPLTDAAPGLVAVEATVDVPSSGRLRSVDFFFNDVKFGSATAPPFRQALAANGRFGYIRVVAMLEDNSTGEDARLINAGGLSESVAVQGVTLIATVLDRTGRRIDDLKSSDFVVTEEGRPIQTSVVNGDPSDPVTVAFAIDSSDSMAVSMLFARELASRFAASSLRSMDRILLVAFDTMPRLARAATGDATSFQQAVNELRAHGGTSIFDGVLFSLLQIQSTPGKKALLVISDGGEGHSSTNAKTCVRTAKALGIPIYGISPPGAERTLNPLDDLAAMTGGVFVHAPARQELPALTARIRDEIRGQYLITFVSKLPPKPGAWRTLKVTVPSRPDAVVRTISGYYAK